MTNEIFEKYMFRCLELAAKGLGKTKSNPLVGSVIVHNDQIIGEGYHREYGGPHAEVNAIHSVTQPSLLKESTLFVNLEPCCHFGKTPPCTHLIKESGIARVVIGTTDPNPMVRGKGIGFLRENGIRVINNILEPECRFLNRRFFVSMEKKRPYIILKWAQSADGFIDTRTLRECEKPRSIISGQRSRILVHKWRSEEMGIMTGTNTANMDNPSLTVRYWTGDNPVRICMERNTLLNPDLSILNDGFRTIIYTTSSHKNTSQVEYIKLDNDPLTLKSILDDLSERGIISLFVEGGTTLAGSFIEQNLWDEARIFTGNRVLNKGLKAPVLHDSGDKYTIGEDELEVIFNRF